MALQSSRLYVVFTLVSEWFTKASPGAKSEIQYKRKKTESQKETKAESTGNSVLQLLVLAGGMNFPKI